MAKITAYKSDITGELIADEKQLARIRVTFPNDRRRSVRVIDASAGEAEHLLGDYGALKNAPGRKPNGPADAAA